MGGIEAADGSSPADFIFEDRKEEILNPNLSNIEKIGKMARLCYRSEPKESENQHDVDLRVIKHCIESGHESVLEHGIVSVFINPEATEDSKHYGEVYLKDKSPINFRQVFAMGATDAQMKFTEQFMDPELYDKFVQRTKYADQNKKILPCLVADVRAWRQIVRERIYLETQSRNKVALALTLKLLFELDAQDEDHILFNDLVNDINDGLFKEEKFVETFGVDGMSAFAEGEELNLANYCKHVFTDPTTLIAGQASSCASISIILTTDRVTSHQHVRHRKNVAYSQESQRYVNYDKKGVRIIPLTMEPSKFEKWCEENGKSIDDIFDDYDLGRVRKDKIGAYYFTPWNEGVVHAVDSYRKCLNLDKYWKNLEPEYKTNLPPMPTETARDKLENDVATRLGVTWLRTSSFINFVFWRLDEHAQYSIRSALARIIKNAFSMNHPFCETIPHKLAMSWFELIKAQKLFKDNSDLDKIVEYREGINKSVQKYIQEHAAELEAQRTKQ